MDKIQLVSPIILQIETTTKTCSVALAANGKLIAIEESTDNFSHAESITLFMQKVLAKTAFKASQLDAIAVSGGPGSYTGIRIGMATAKGLSYSLGIPLIKLNSLLPLANGMVQNYPDDLTDVLIVPMIDARRMEVFMAIFDQDIINILPTSAEVINESFFDHYKGKKLLLGGTGAKKVVDLLNNSFIEFIEIKHSAKWLCTPALKAFEKKEFEKLITTTADYYKDYYFK